MAQYQKGTNSSRLFNLATRGFIEIPEQRVSSCQDQTVKLEIRNLLPILEVRDDNGCTEPETEARHSNVHNSAHNYAI
jgi:hypothetical protein